MNRLVTLGLMLASFGLSQSGARSLAQAPANPATANAPERLGAPTSPAADRAQPWQALLVELKKTNAQMARSVAEARQTDEAIDALLLRVKTTDTGLSEAQKRLETRDFRPRLARIAVFEPTEARMPPPLKPAPLPAELRRQQARLQELYQSTVRELMERGSKSGDPANDAMLVVIELKRKHDAVVLARADFDRFLRELFVSPATTGNLDGPPVGDNAEGVFVDVRERFATALRQLELGLRGARGTPTGQAALESASPARPPKIAEDSEPAPLTYQERRDETAELRRRLSDQELKLAELVREVERLRSEKSR